MPINNDLGDKWLVPENDEDGCILRWVIIPKSAIDEHGEVDLSLAVEVPEPEGAYV